jgi:predicted nucleotidyltransferase component of viral defense system
MSLKLNVLPLGQKALWNKLHQVPSHFTLYGGTALALQLGHRESVDFDFFSPKSFCLQSLQAEIEFLKSIEEVIQNSANTVEAIVRMKETFVKVSFFGDINFGHVRNPFQNSENGVWIASKEDIFAWKLKTLCARIEPKDFLDVATLLEAGYSLEQGISWALSLFKKQMNTTHPLKALSYLDIPPLASLSEKVRSRIKSSLKSFDPTAVKAVEALPTRS